MKQTLVIPSIVLALVTCLAYGADVASAGCRWVEPSDDARLTSAVSEATSPDTAVAQKAIATLRAAGPRGLKAVLRQYDQTGSATFLPAIDAVAAQRGAAVSRLYWYTDLDQAKAAAKAEHKPIIYLRLLGKLTDEYSCANSRFFRTVLYSNEQVSKMLREQFILVWISERPVPVVTIDYGDGRVLKRTLTGNSIHYVLNEDGQIVDALPGLYGPKAFLSILSSAREVASYRAMQEPAIANYLNLAGASLIAAWNTDTARQTSATELPQGAVVNMAGVRNPAARLAMPRAVSKSVVETPLLVRLTPDYAVEMEKSVTSANSAMWDKIAARHAEDARLDASSIAVIRSQNPQAYADDAALNSVVDHFQKLIAMDTVRNNYQYRRQILSWLKESPGKVTVEDLNRRVYSELFLTPATDPWLGLMTDSTYTALTNDGCAVGAKGK